METCASGFSVPNDKMRSGGPLVVSFRRIPLFAMISENVAAKVLVDLGSGMFAALSCGLRCGQAAE